MTTNHNKAISRSSPKRAVVLLSGGLDSATSLAIAKSQGYLCHCLTVLYGQRHSIEVEAASGVALHQGVAEHRFVSVDLRVFGGSALTADLEVPKDSLSITGIPVTYVPARNTVFLALALGFAEVVDAAAIFVGVNAVDYSGYPDCRPEFIAAFQNLASLATKSGVEGVPFRIEAPLINLTKTEIIQIGLSLGVDYSLTHSCYDPEGGNACGRCDSCLIRLKAFSELGLSDPAIRERG